MEKERICFPDENAVNRVLVRTQTTVAELILRLAWDAGLSRDEICALKWGNISFKLEQIQLPDRSIPVSRALLNCLRLRQEMYGNDSEYVVTSDRLHKPMRPESVSRAARVAMDTEPSLEDIRLIDLRHGFIIRQLQQSDWNSVARISGISVRTMQALFLPSASDRVVQSRSESVAYDEEAIQGAIASAENEVIALALRLIWDVGLQAQQCIALTWDQICWTRGVICLPDREVPASAEVLRRLRALFDRRQPEEDLHVLLTSKSKAPYGLPGLSKEIRTALIRAGVDATLQDILRYREHSACSEQILQLAQEKKQLTRQDLIHAFHLTAAQANERLRRMTASGALVRIGTIYYLADDVVPPHHQYQVVQAHLQTAGTAYRKELADLLGLGVRQCGWILHKWVQEGQLATHGQSYSLPDSDFKKEFDP